MKKFIHKKLNTFKVSEDKSIKPTSTLRHQPNTIILSDKIDLKHSPIGLFQRHLGTRKILALKVLGTSSHMGIQWEWGIVHSSTWGTRVLERHLGTATRRRLGHLGTQKLGHWGTRRKFWTLSYSRHSVTWALKRLRQSIQQTPLINMNISNNSRKYIAKETITKKLSFAHNTNKECIKVKQWHFVKLSL